MEKPACWQTGTKDEAIKREFLEVPLNDWFILIYV
jgi:hypothetical protein